MPFDVGQAEITSLKTVRELGVIDPQTAQRGRIEIMNMHRITHDVVAEIVGLAVGLSAANATSRCPQRKAATMMVTPVIVCGQGSLTIHGATELATENHQRFVEQAPRFQVFDERGNGTVNILTLSANL